MQGHAALWGVTDNSTGCVRAVLVSHSQVCTCPVPWDAPKVPPPQLSLGADLHFPGDTLPVWTQVSHGAGESRVGGAGQGGPPYQVMVPWDLTMSGVGWKERREHLFWQMGLLTKLTSLRAPPGWGTAPGHALAEDGHKEALEPHLCQRD